MGQVFSLRTTSSLSESPAGSRTNLRETISQISADQAELNELRKENKFLRELTKSQSAQPAQSMREERTTPAVASRRREHVLSDKRIGEFVDKLLEDEHVNISYLPDVVERQLYINVLRLIVDVIDEVVDTSKIHVIGHEVTFDMHPAYDA